MTKQEIDCRAGLTRLIQQVWREVRREKQVEDEYMNTEEKTQSTQI